MTAGTLALLVEAAILGGAYVWGLHKPLTGGAGVLFRVSLWGGAVSLLMLAAAVVMDVPDSRGLFVALLLAGIVAATARALSSVSRRAAELHAETQQPSRQPAQQAAQQRAPQPDVSRYTVRQAPVVAGGSVRAQAGARSARVRRIQAMGGNNNGV